MRKAPAGFWIDDTVAVHREEDRAFEAVPLRKNLRQHGQSFFGTILLIAAQEDDVFAFAGARFAFVLHPVFGVNGGEREDRNSDGGKKFLHKCFWFAASHSQAETNWEGPLFGMSREG